MGRARQQRTDFGDPSCPRCGGTGNYWLRPLAIGSPYDHNGRTIACPNRCGTGGHRVTEESRQFRLPRSPRPLDHEPNG